MQQVANLYYLMGRLGSTPRRSARKDYIMRKLYWMFYRMHRRLVFKLINYLIKRYGWHNNVLDSSIPNVSTLRLKAITIINRYDQEHTYTF